MAEANDCSRQRVLGAARHDAQLERLFLSRIGYVSVSFTSRPVIGCTPALETEISRSATTGIEQVEWS